MAANSFLHHGGSTGEPEEAKSENVNEQNKSETETTLELPADKLEAAIARLEAEKDARLKAKLAMPGYVPSICWGGEDAPAVKADIVIRWGVNVEAPGVIDIPPPPRLSDTPEEIPEPARATREKEEPEPDWAEEYFAANPQAPRYSRGTSWD